MSTYKGNLAQFARNSGSLSARFLDKSESYEIKKEHDDAYNLVHYVQFNGVKLSITDRADLLNLKDLIDKILEDCKDDGFEYYMSTTKIIR